MWADGFGGPGHDDGTSVVADGSGGVYFTGDMVGNVAFGPVCLTNSTIYTPSNNTFNDAVVGHIDSAAP